MRGKVRTYLSQAQEIKQIDAKLSKDFLLFALQPAPLSYYIGKRVR